MKIIHPTDFSATAEAAEAQAVRLTRALSAELVLLHVGVEAPLFREGAGSMDEVARVYAAQRAWASKELAIRGARLAEGGLACRWLLRTGVPHEEIVRVAREEGAAYVVMGTHGRGGLERWLLGSVADRVIRTASCPIVVVRAPEPAA